MKNFARKISGQFAPVLGGQFNRFVQPTNRNGIIDNVEGGDWTAPNFTNQKMFDCLESTTQSPIQFRDKFIQRYGQSQSLQINQLFQSYGY